jgi:hypothetical protein
MIKARKHDIAQLERISSELNHGLELLMSDKYQIMTHSKLSSTDVFTASFYPNERYNKIQKQYGNELCCMWTAIRDLNKMLKGDK